jgi:Outer membrane protein beta-barrel domain
MQISSMFPRSLILVAIVFCLTLGRSYGQKDLSPAPLTRAEPDLFEVSAGFNYIYLDNQFPETKNLYGVDASLFVNATSWLGVGGDFMADFGSHSVGTFFGQRVDVDSQRYVYVFGPRVTIWRNPQFRVFAEGLAGGVHAEAQASLGTRSQGASDDGFAAAVGAGFDWRLTEHLSWRVVQADYLPTHLGSDWQNNFRASTGIVYLFGHR